METDEQKKIQVTSIKSMVLHQAPPASYHMDILSASAQQNKEKQVNHNSMNKYSNAVFSMTPLTKSYQCKQNKEGSL